MSDSVTEIRTLGDTVYFPNVHDEHLCMGSHCIVHNPVEPTKNRPLLWRSDRGFFEEICSCGIGHPAEEEYTHLSNTDLVHGCCGVAGHCRPWHKKLSVQQRYEAGKSDRALIFRYSDQDWIAYHPNGMWLGERFATFEEAREYVCKTLRET